MHRDVCGEEEKPWQRHQVSEVESLVGMFAVPGVEFFLVNSHSGANEEGHGQQCDAECPVEEHQ